MTKYYCDICGNAITSPSVFMEVRVVNEDLTICKCTYMLCPHCAKMTAEQINEAKPTIGMTDDFLMEEDEIEMD